MRCRRYLSIALVGAVEACSTASGRPLTPLAEAAIRDSVRQFAATVATDISHDGPAAWRRHFATSASFFMASEGQLVFSSSDAATPVIQDRARTITHIELTWGDSVRVDPIAPGLAVLGASYHELRVDTAGQRVDERGYMTGLVEDRMGRWQFRDLHWSVVAPPAARSLSATR
jgi:hypothetical protein